MDALDKYVAELRSEKGDGVPGFSERDGRAEAKVLFLHRDPGSSGASKTRLVDRDNPYTTAKHFREANVEADPDRKSTVTWNAVPWPVKGSTFTEALEKIRSAGWLGELSNALPRSRVVVLLGGDAHRWTPCTRSGRTCKSSMDPTRPTSERRKWLGNTVRKTRDLLD